MEVITVTCNSLPDALTFHPPKKAAQIIAALEYTCQCMPGRAAFLQHGGLALIGNDDVAPGTYVFHSPMQAGELTIR